MQLDRLLPAKELEARAVVPDIIGGFEQGKYLIPFSFRQIITTRMCKCSVKSPYKANAPPKGGQPPFKIHHQPPTCMGGWLNYRV